MYIIIVLSPNNCFYFFFIIMALLEKHNPQNTSEISQSSAEIAGVLVAVRDAQGNLVTTFLENVTEISGTTKKGEVTLNTET